MKRLIRLFTSVLVTGALSACVSTPEMPCDVDIVPEIFEPYALIESLNSVPRRNIEREDLVVRTFAAMGCNVERQPLGHRSSNNIICRIEGVSEEQILVTAHHDSLGSGKGVADNWTGVSVLFSLARHYLQHPPIHTLVFIAFADEEDDMKGSHEYVRQIRRNQVQRPRLVVNIDTLGVSDLRLGRRSSPQLACIAKSVDRGQKIAGGTTRLNQMTGDWEPFVSAGIPTIDFHSLDEKTMRFLHTYRDRRDLIDDHRFYESYQIIANTLSALDHGIDLVTGSLN